MDSAISEKLEKMIPGVIEKIKREIRREAKDAGSENKFSSALMRFWAKSSKGLLEEYEKVMKRMELPVETIEEVHELEGYLVKKVDEEMQVLAKEQTKLLQIWEVIEKNEYHNEEDRLALKEVEVTASKILELKKERLKELKMDKKKLEKDFEDSQREFRKMITAGEKNM